MTRRRANQIRKAAAALVVFSVALAASGMPRVAVTATSGMLATMGEGITSLYTLVNIMRFAHATAEAPAAAVAPAPKPGEALPEAPMKCAATTLPAPLPSRQS